MLKPLSLLAVAASVTLAGCVLMPGEVSVHEVLLYGLGERHVFFYSPGSETTSPAQAIKLGEQTLELSTKPAAGPLAVPEALSVAGKPTLALKTGTIREVMSLATIPFSSDLSLASRSGLEAVYFSDGSAWFDASGPVNADSKLRLRTAKRTTLRGVGQLSDAEADALAGYLAGKGAVGVALLAPQVIPDAALRFDPAPKVYRRTALYVQVGVPTDVLGGFAQAAPLGFKALAAGGNSAYAESGSDVRLDASAADLERTWKIVGGNQIPQPAPPSVDFRSGKVVTVFLGQKPTGGYGIAVAGVRADGRTLVVEVNLSEPRAGAILTQAFTSPYASVVVTGFDGSSVRVVNKANGRTIAQR